MSMARWTRSTGVGSRSTNFIKCQPLATGSTARIKPSESLSWLLISVVHHRSNGWVGWLRPGAARARTHGSSFLKPWWSVSDVVCSYGITMESSNGEAARLVLGDGEVGLRWSFDSKDVRRGFLELPSSFSTDQFLRTAAENSNLVST
jgi:hypothetical protein